MPAKRYTLLLANRTTGSVRRLTISLRPTLAVLVVLLSLPVMMALGARWSVHDEMAELRSANGLLSTQNDSYRAATAELAVQISSLQAAVTELGDSAHLDPAALAAIEKLPGMSRARAVGGSMTPLERAALSATMS